MNNSEKDKLTIQRDGLLKKKRILDAIEKLRQISPKGKIDFQTNCYNLANASNVDEWVSFNSLLDTIASEGAAEFSIGRSLGGSPWGESSVNIKITKQFDKVYNKISEDFHEINKKLGKEKGQPSALITNKKLGNDVFIVHGHDEALKESVARFIEKLDLKAIILHEQPNKGRTVIEKFEDYSNVGFAVVLLTPDDVGCKNGAKDFEERARQNVILELGYFIGKLKRNRVCVLYKKNVERPSDISGVVYVPVNSNDNWKLKLAKEIKEAGIDVDLNKI